MFRGVTDAASKELLFGVQLEMDKAGDMYTGKYSGFSIADEGIFAALMQFIGQKVSELNYCLEVQKKTEEHIKALDYINKLLENKTVPQFVTCVREVLPSYLNFQYGSILFYTEKSKLLPTTSRPAVHLLCPAALYGGV